jgi:hypothetical protein
LVNVHKFTLFVSSQITLLSKHHLLIVLIRLMLSDSLCHKVITLSSFHCTFDFLTYSRQVNYYLQELISFYVLILHYLNDNIIPNPITTKWYCFLSNYYWLQYRNDNIIWLITLYVIPLSRGSQTFGTCLLHSIASNHNCKLKNCKL